MDHVDDKLPSLEYTIGTEPHAERLTRYIAFCIPARFGLFACTMFLSLFAVAFVAIGWVVANKMGSHITEFQRLAVFFHILVYAILLIFCVFGIYAVVSKHAKHSSMFCAMVFGQVFIGIASGALSLFLLFNPSKANILSDLEQCLATVASSPNDPFIKDLCLRTDLAKGVCLGLFLFMWLFEIFTFYAGNQYATQLYEEALQKELFEPSTGKESFYC